MSILRGWKKYLNRVPWLADVVGLLWLKKVALVVQGGFGMEWLSWLGLPLGRARVFRVVRVLK